VSATVHEIRDNHMHSSARARRLTDNNTGVDKLKLTALGLSQLNVFLLMALTIAQRTQAGEG
jgi:hypothetical protein